MTYDEITLWRRWMQGKSILNSFEYLYKSHRFDKRDLDQYLEDIAAEDVILSAFDFSGAGNTIFSFKYWKEIDRKWQARLREFRDNGNMMEAPMVLCLNCKRMLPRSAFDYTAKGVLHKHCRECEGGEWARKQKELEKQKKEQEAREKAVRQLEKEIAEKQAKLERLSTGMEPATPPEGKVIENNRAETARQQIAEGQANLDKTTKVCEHCGSRKLRSEFYPSDTSEDGLQSWCKKCQDAASNVSAQADWLTERKAKMEERIAKTEEPKVKEEEPKEEKAVPEVNTPPAMSDRRLIAPKLGEHDITLHYKKNQKSLTFNAALSQQIRDGQYTKCYLNPDRNMRQFLILNRVEGSNITGTSTMTQALLNVTSADIVRALAARFNLDEGDNYYLHVTKNLSKVSEFMTLEIIKARTREEYIRLVERREQVASGGLVPGEDIPEYETFVQAPEKPAPEETPANVGTVEDSTDAPLLEFDFTEPGSGKPMSAEQVLQAVLDRHLATEMDIAAFLYNRGWKLEQPVVITKTNYKKFSI